jgi:hypothetical protein
MLRCTAHLAFSRKVRGVPMNSKYFSKTVSPHEKPFYGLNLVFLIILGTLIGKETQNDIYDSL